MPLSLSSHLTGTRSPSMTVRKSAEGESSSMSPANVSAGLRMTDAEREFAICRALDSMTYWLHQDQEKYAIAKRICDQLIAGRRKT